MLINRLAMSPPTITMAKGRWESEPMAWDMAAGNKPSVATNMVIMIGRSRSVAPSMAAVLTGIPRARNWLMYSTMITPVWTRNPEQGQETNSRRDTEMRPRDKQGHQTSERSNQHVDQVQQCPLDGAESAINDHDDEEKGYGDDNQKPRLRSLLALVFAFPVDVVSRRQFDLFLDLLDRLFDGAPQVAAANAILDGNVALVAFPVDFRTAVLFFDCAELRE